MSEADTDQPNAEPPRRLTPESGTKIAWTRGCTRRSDVALRGVVFYTFCTEWWRGYCRSELRVRPLRQ